MCDLSSPIYHDKGVAHTNTIEGFFSVFKRGMQGVYQHCSEDHLHRYLAEFDFRTTTAWPSKSTTRRELTPL